MKGWQNLEALPGIPSSSGFHLRWSISMQFGLRWTSSSTTLTWSFSQLGMTFDSCLIVVDIYIYIYYSIVYIYSCFDEFSWLFWCVWMFPQDHSNDMMQHCSIQWLFDRTSWEFSLNTIYDYLCVLQSHACSHVHYIYTCDYMCMYIVVCSLYNI